jgi:ankyrin repeat protein
VFLMRLTRILLAAEQGDVDELKHWTSQGKNLNAKEGHLRAVKYLSTQESVSKQEKDSDGRTALHLAAAEGKYEVVQYLCTVAKLDVNAKDWRGLTPLHLGKHLLGPPMSQLYRLATFI